MSKRRSKRFRPSASKIIEHRKRTEKTNQVYIPPDIDREFLDKFYGKIFFWSFTIGKVKPHDHATKFRICTHRFINIQKIISLVEGVFPGGCRITPVGGYSFRHTFDVRTAEPMRWDEFVWRVTKALEGVL